MKPEQKKIRDNVINKVEDRMIEMMESFQLKPDCIYIDFRTYENYRNTFPKAVVIKQAAKNKKAKKKNFEGNVESIFGLQLIVLPFPAPTIEVGFKNPQTVVKYGHERVKAEAQQFVKSERIKELRKQNHTH